jgi:hypothetical protein
MRNACLLACLLTLGALGLTARTAVSASARNAGTLAVSAAASPSQGQFPPASQTFTGRIAHTDGKFVLQDSSDNGTFLLDDQEKAKEFNGKNVKVTGTLDPNNNLIHVVDIEEA